MKLPVKRYAVAAIVALGVSMAPGELRTSREAQIKIATREECRATPYRDIAGVMTVGCGSTGAWRTGFTEKGGGPPLGE